MTEGYINALVTFIVGFFAIFLYLKGRKDNKRDAASIVLLEIKNAERKIKQAREKSKDQTDWSDELPIVSDESWSKYKYLFVKNFDSDEWASINDFYDKCRLYDYSTAGGSSAFSKNEEQIRINVHRIFADYLKELIDSVGLMTSESDMQAALHSIKQKVQVFKDSYLNGDSDFIKPMYTPQKYLDDRNRLLDLIDTNISKGSIGTKLKNIAKIKP